MAEHAPWRKNLTFSDRLAVTSKISWALRTAEPGCTPAEASKRAKSEEEAARKEALTLDEYHKRCSEAVQRLLNAALNQVDGPPESGTVDVETPKEGVQIGRYSNAQHYENGLFSDVFKAKDPKTSSFVALKVTNPSMMTAPHDSAREARILAASKGPNIIELLETFPQAGGRLVLAFPFVPCDLSTLLRNDALPASAQQPLLHNLFTALAHLHDLGIIHRDVKPSNILLATPSGPAYLADFGIAWSPSDPASEAPDSKYLEVGTTSYRPPELLFGCQTYGPALDLWAAGCVAAQILCLGAQTLFDAGDLGSELALIKSIFETLGTPDLDIWPEAAALPDWGKMNFTKYPGKSWEETLPDIGSEARVLVSELVRYESGQRLSAVDALRHPYFKVANGI